MNKFNFSAESVLRHKEWLETEAQRILGLELNKLSIFKETLDALTKEQQRFIKDRQEKKNLDPETHLAYIQFDNKLTVDINEQKNKIAAQQMVIKEKTSELQGAVTERKKLEKLREREMGEYSKKSKRKENSKMDEISSNFYDRNPETI